MSVAPAIAYAAVSPRPRGRRAASLGAILLVACLSVSACGSSDAKADDRPTATSETSTTTTPDPTPEPTPTPTPAAAPLSAFEDQGPVRAARQFFVLLAKAVNSQERSLASVAGSTTAHGLETAKFFAHDDLVKGYVLPGPEPFTPVGVQVRGGVAKVSTCLQFAGWSVDPKTGKVVGKRDIGPAVIAMRKVGGDWKFDDYYDGTGDCHGVAVPGVRW